MTLTVLAVGTQSTVDYHWGSVRSQVAVSQAGSITARLFNPGTSTVTVKFSLTSNVLPL